jgi:hypothetical protein
MKIIQRYHPYKLGNFIGVFSIIVILLGFNLLFLRGSLPSEFVIMLYIVAPIALLLDIYMIFEYNRKSFLIGKDSIIGGFIQNIEEHCLKAKRSEVKFSEISSVSEIKFTKMGLNFHLVEITKISSDKIHLIISPFTNTQKKEIIALLNIFCKEKKQ